jgi:isochorismate hydrolase
MVDLCGAVLLIHDLIGYVIEFLVSVVEVSVAVVVAMAEYMKRIKEKEKKRLVLFIYTSKCYALS